jgi:hypothetical protein
MRDDFEVLDDPLGRLIDRALQSYTPRNPLPGLEQRILAGVATANRRRAPWGWRGWNSIAAVAAAALLLVLVAIPLRHRLSPPHITVASRSAQPAEQLSPGALTPQDAGQHDSNSRAKQVRAIKLRPAGSDSGAVVTPRSSVRRASTAVHDESMAFAPIALKPIAVAPIEIPALN